MKSSALFFAVSASFFGCGQDGKPPVSADNRAGSASASIQVFEEGVGASGRVAVFQDHAGVILSTAETAPDGSAQGAVISGDMVTLANLGSTKFDLTTYIELKPGDIAVLGEGAESDSDEAGVAGIRCTTLGALPGPRRAHSLTNTQDVWLGTLPPEQLPRAST
jgi:hypothetical protein